MNDNIQLATLSYIPKTEMEARLQYALTDTIRTIAQVLGWDHWTVQEIDGKWRLDLWGGEAEPETLDITPEDDLFGSEPTYSDVLHILRQRLVLKGLKKIS